MKKKIAVGLFIAVLICLTVVLLIVKGVIVFDHSVERTGTGFIWNGVNYIECSGDYHEGKTIAKTSDGYSINEVKEDSTHTFLVIRSFLDQYLCVRDDYEIPDGGNLNAVFWRDAKIADSDFCAAVSAIIYDFKADARYQTEGIYMLTDAQQMYPVSFCYDNCPVGIDTRECYMGTLNGEWVFAMRSADSPTEYGEPRSYDIDRIPDEYLSVIQKYVP